MKIKVIAEDIEHGLPCEEKGCPIALAVSRALGIEAGKVSISLDDVFVSGAEFTLPAKAVAFISRFDDGKTVKPFTFTIKGLK